MLDNRMELIFDSLSQNEAFARAEAAAFASQMNPTIADLTDIRTAVSEAVTNAIIHGYGNRPDKKVYMRCLIEGDCIEISVEDKGKGIENISLAMQPFYTTMPSLERSGMGFAVMEAFMDSLEIESAPGEGTAVIMEKELGRARGD